ncbi:MAG: FUSC family protein [Alphaproteobacteria bacterium]|nr:FUSC family protein [Alphaproteobacteria bacterium]
MSAAQPAAVQSPLFGWVGSASGTLQAAVPALLFGLRLWASVCLALYVAFWLELDTPSWAGTTAALVCQPHLGASLRKGWYRLIGTLVGAVAIVVITACFPQDRAAFLLVLALWGAGCALLANLLRNFASYSAALAGYTVAIIASDQLGATGGLNGQAFMLAVTRASEICIGIVCAGIVLAGTDFGGARRRVASLFAQLSAEIACRFSGTLADAGTQFEQTQTIRRELLRRVVALDPVIDEALGESSELRYHSPVLQNALDGLVRALAGWRTVAVVLARSRQQQARQEAGTLLAEVPEQLRAKPGEDEAARWLTHPARLLQACDAAVRKLFAVPAAIPSLRLLADQAAETLAGISQALIALGLLVADPAWPVSHIRGRRRLRIPDWLPPLVNAGRVFVVIGAAQLFWIVTAWPGGANAITFAAIIVILFAPRADQAYNIAIGFMIGSVLTVVIVATLLFAVLPNVETFAGFSLIIGLVLVPVGLVFAVQWQPAVFTGMITVFVPLLAPTNPMNYDTQQYYNTALTIIAGAGAGALSYRLLPPLSPAYRSRRLLASTLRDLRRLATSPLPDTAQDWEQRMFARFALLPDQAQPLQRSWLTAALSAGSKIIQLRHLCPGFGLSLELDAALEAVAGADGARATEKLAEIDAELSARPGDAALRARGLILAISATLTQHAAYFGAGAPV